MDQQENLGSQQNTLSVRSWAVTLGIFVVVFVLGLYVFQKTIFNNSESTIQQKENITEREEGEVDIQESISTADITAVDKIATPDSVNVSSVDEAREAFDLSTLTFAFGLTDTTTGYLVKILDSEGEGYDEYRAIAGYFLLHTYYDEGRDVEALKNAINKSTFMSSLTSEAAEIFPDVFTVSTEDMLWYEESKYLAAYLIALNNHFESLAMPANAANLLAEMYTYNKSEEDVGSYEEILNENFEKALDTYKRTLAGELPGLLTAHDTVVGINNLALAIERLRAAGVTDRYPSTADVDLVSLYEVSHHIARENVPQLLMFTNYLYARQLALSLEDEEDNNTVVDQMVVSIVGTAPFENLTENSWAARRLVPSKGAIGFMYGEDSVAAIARKSSTMREFLVMKAGWEEGSWELK